MYIEEYPGCCTTSILLDFGGKVDVEDNPIVDPVRLSMLEETGAYLENCLDEAILTATTTEGQVTAVAFLEKVGFQKVFVGAKTRDRNRHKESGEITLWAINPQDWSDWQTKYKEEKAKKPKKDLKSVFSRLRTEHGVNVAEPAPAAVHPAPVAVNKEYPSITLMNMRSAGIVHPYIDGGNTWHFAKAYGDGYGWTPEKILETFGVYPRDFGAGVRMELALGELRNAQRAEEAAGRITIRRG